MSLAAVVGSTREKKTMIRQILRHIAWGITVTFALAVGCYVVYGVYWMAMEQPWLLVVGGITGLVVSAIVYLVITDEET
jgi:membrane protein YdbS with pleckstrin-like domain